MSTPSPEEPKPIFWLGPILMGSMLNWLLMGTVIVQSFYYRLSHSKDRPAIQVLVYGVVLLDAVQTAFATHNTWWLAIDTLGQGLRPTWSASTVPGMAGITSAIVQIFYAWRISKLSQTLYMRAFAILIVFLAISQCTSSIVSSSAIGITDIVEWELKLRTLHPAITVWLVLSFCNDIIISGCMIFILSQAKYGVVQISRTKKILDRLILNAIQTGTITAVCAGVNLFLFLQYSNAFYYIAPGMIAGKLYTNSLLSTLNSCDFHLKKANMSDTDTISMRVHVSRMTERMEETDQSSNHHAHHLKWDPPAADAKKATNLADTTL